MRLKKFNIVINLIILFYAIPSTYAYMVDRTVALVNKQVITNSDIEKFNRQMKLRRELDPFIAFFSVSLKTDKEILDFLIQEDLILDKLKPSGDDVENEIRSIEKKNQINRERLKEILRAQGINFEDYTQLMEVSLAKRRLMDQELRPLSVVTDDEVKNYYLSDPEFGKGKNQRHLVLSYHLQQIFIPNSSLLDVIVEKLKTTENPEALQSEYEDRGVSTTDLGSVREDHLTPQVQKAIQGLKIGDVTAPIPLAANAGGYQVLKIISISTPEDPLYEKEKEKIRGFLFEKAMKAQLELWTERQKSSSYIHIP